MSSVVRNDLLPSVQCGRKCLVVDVGRQFLFRRVRLTAISHERVLEIEGKELSRLLRSDSVDKNANYVLAEVRINLSGHRGRTSSIDLPSAISRPRSTRPGIYQII